MQYGGQIIGQLPQLQQMNRGNLPMPLHPTALPNRGLLNQHQQHSLAGSLGAGGLSGSPLSNGLQVVRLRPGIGNVYLPGSLIPVFQNWLWQPSLVVSGARCRPFWPSSVCVCTSVCLCMAFGTAFALVMMACICCPRPGSIAK